MKSLQPTNVSTCQFETIDNKSKPTNHDALVIQEVRNLLSFLYEKTKMNDFLIIILIYQKHL